VLTDDRPAADAAEPFDSPASVTISTGDGVTLHSVSMAWGSESASEGESASGHGAAASHT